jgi:hypothetical protein
MALGLTQPLREMSTRNLPGGKGRPERRADNLTAIWGRAVAQSVSRWLPTAAARVRVRAEHVGFAVDKAALGQVFSEYFGFPYQSSLHQFLHHHNQPRLAQQAYRWPQCRGDTIGLHPQLFQLKKINRYLCADCLENVGASISHNPMGLHGLIQEG